MSDNYIVSARKYRPSTFRSVVGQKNLTSTLLNAIKSRRMAQAYLFCGPRGVGKTSCARIFAKTINCLNPTAEGEACGQCDSCLAIDRGNSYNLVELDAASNNGVDDIRAITDQVNVPPQIGKYRVFIIDEVHMLSSQAFNAFLKTLEEPPSYAIFILATTEKHKVIPTILSRCQIYDFKRITIADTVEHLQYVAEQEGIKADARALGVIARKADGAMRDALSIFDQVSASTRGNITYEATIENLNVLDYEYFFKLVDAFAKGDVQSALLLYKDVRDKGFDSLFFVNSLAQHIRDLMVAADARTLSLLEMPEDAGKRLCEQARTFPLQWYYTAMKVLNDCDLNYRTASNKQFLVELALIRLCQLQPASGNPFEEPDRVMALRDPAPAEKLAAPVTPVGSAPVATAAPSASVHARVETTVEKKTAQMPERGTRPHTFRLSDSAKSDVGALESRKKEFSDEEFQTAWKALAEKTSSAHMLSDAIRGAEVVRENGVNFKVYVSHLSQVQSIESHIAKVSEFLRNALSNDMLTFNVMVNPKIGEVKRLSPQEFVRDAVSRNPMLGEFLRSIDAEMS